MARKDDAIGPCTAPIEILDDYLPNFPNVSVAVQLFTDGAATTPATPQGSVKVEYLHYGTDLWVEDANSPYNLPNSRLVSPDRPVKGIRATPVGIETSLFLKMTYIAIDAAYSKTMSAPTDAFGNASRSTLTQESLVGQREDFINVQFQYNLPVNDDTSDIIGSTDGTGTLGHSDSMAELTTTGAGRASLASRDSIRYYPGHEFAAEMTALAATPPVEGKIYWGIGDMEGVGDAMAFGYDGPEFGIFIRRDGVEVFTPKSEFSDGAGVEVDPAKLNLWVFRGGWYGVLPLQFGVYHNGRYVLLHEYDITNKDTKPHLSNPTLPMFLEINSTVNDPYLTAQSASWRGGITGPIPAGSRADRVQSHSVIGRSITGGVETPVITIKNSTSFQGKVNHVRVRYGTVALSVDGNKPVVWRVVKNPTIVGPTYNSKNPDTSVIEYDTTAASISGGTEIGGTVMGKISTIRINLFEGDVTLPVYPGETITLTAESTSSSEVSVFFRWIEEF